VVEQTAEQGRLLPQAFRRIGQTLVSGLDVKEVLGSIVDEAMAQLDAEVTMLRLLDRPGEQLELEVSRGVPADIVRQIHFRPGEGLAGRLLLDGRPMRGINLQQDPRTKQRALAHRYNWQAFAAVAIHLHQQPIGVWFLIRHRREPFTKEDVLLLSTFADYASLAIERSWLLQTIVLEKHESEAVIQASASGILVVDAYGRVVDMNPALERLTGWSQRQARGLPCCDVVGCHAGLEEGATSELCPLQVAARRGDRGFIEYQLQAQDGNSIPVEASYGLIWDENGELYRIVIVFRDISRQKELNRLRAEIVANVSHELRTPLSLIKGYATTLLSPDVTLEEAETRRFLTNVSSAADHLGRLIDDLLCASRIETQQLKLEPKRFDLCREVRQVLAWFQPHASDLQLVADLPRSELWVWADPDRVHQVLMNLLSNAAKYSRVDGTVTVRSQIMGESPVAVVHVTDEGSGIAPEHLPNVFDRFYLTEESRKGIGLGLYICKGLVEAMGGDIWVVSEVDAGSTFSFTLPVQAGKEATVAGRSD
jgi:PAS domain S-box-containing protein